MYVYGLVVEDNGGGGWYFPQFRYEKNRWCKRLADKIKLEPMIGIEPMTDSLYLNKNLHVSRKNKKLLWYNSIVWLIKLEMTQRAVNLLLGYR